MDTIDEVTPTPRILWLHIMLANWQSRWWAVQHWARVHLTGLHFCPSCAGYFQEWCMALPDKCDACYARDYGIPVPAEVTES